MLKDLRDFIFKGNVIDLAVGVVMGLAFQSVVKAVVDNLIMSPIAAVFGEPNFDKLAVGPFQYGAFLTALLQFVIIGTTLFFFVVKPSNHFLKRMGLLKDAPPMRDCPACLQSVPAAATKCMYCTIDLEPQEEPAV